MSEPLQRSLVAAVLRAELDGSSGPEALRAAALSLLADGAHHGALVEAAWSALHGPARLSDRRRHQLDVALARLDRYADLGGGRRGAGVELAIGVLVAGVLDPEPVELRQLGGLAAWLAATARRWRRDALVRAGRREPYRPRLSRGDRRRGPEPWPED